MEADEEEPLPPVSNNPLYRPVFHGNLRQLAIRG